MTFPSFRSENDFFTIFFIVDDLKEFFVRNICQKDRISSRNSCSFSNLVKIGRGNGIEVGTLVCRPVSSENYLRSSI